MTYTSHKFLDDPYAEALHDLWMWEEDSTGTSDSPVGHVMLFVGLSSRLILGGLLAGGNLSRERYDHDMLTAILDQDLPEFSALLITDGQGFVSCSKFSTEAAARAEFDAASAEYDRWEESTDEIPAP